MSVSQSNFRNVIVCEDIRDEVGNKKSLMGVMGGDILAADFPATIKIAVYMEYLPDADDRAHLAVEFRLMLGEVEIAQGKMEAAGPVKGSATFVLPTGLVVTDKEADFRLFASVNGRPEEEVLKKRIRKLVT